MEIMFYLASMRVCRGSGDVLSFSLSPGMFSRVWDSKYRKCSPAIVTMIITSAASKEHVLMQTEMGLTAFLF